MIFIDYALLIAVCCFACFSKRYLASLGLVSGLIVFEMIHSHGIKNTNCVFLLICMVAMFYMIKEDTLRKGDESFFVRNNPYSKNNKLPCWLQISLLSLFFMAYLVRVLLVIWK